MTTQGSLFQLPSGRLLSYSVYEVKPLHQTRWILLSNPLCASLTIWDDVTEYLAELGYNVLRYDAPGHGGSEVPTDLSSTTFETVADDVYALLRHLDIKTLHAWVGVSFGGATATTFAARYPGVIERLIVCSVSPYSPINAGTPDIFGQRVAAARAAGNLDLTIEQTMNRWFLNRLQHNPSLWHNVRESMKTTSLDGFETCCFALRHPSFDLRRIAAKAGDNVGSALLLVGQYDSLREEMEELKKGIERGQRVKSLRSGKGKAPVVELQVVEDAGHVLFVDALVHFTAIIRRFIDQEIQLLP
ncbi:zearalenone lactonase [Xylaria telfairii]|nr:zearalenone lactonase [Xylaria telfairii]